MARASSVGLSTLWGTRTVRTKRTEREKVKARGTWSGGRRSICTPVRAVLEDRDDKPAGPGRPHIRGGVRASRTQSLTQVVTTTRKHLRGSGVFSGSFPWRYPAYARPDDSHNYPVVDSLNFLCPPSSRRTARRPRPEINNSTSSLSGHPAIQYSESLTKVQSATCAGSNKSGPQPGIKKTSTWILRGCPAVSTIQISSSRRGAAITACQILAGFTLTTPCPWPSYRGLLRSA